MKHALRQTTAASLCAAALAGFGMAAQAAPQPTLNFATDDAIFKEFAVQGQTNLTASGDYSSLKASGPWPEEDANIIAVGGTDVSSVPAGLP